MNWTAALALAAAGLLGAVAGKPAVNAPAVNAPAPAQAGSATAINAPVVDSISKRRGSFGAVRGFSLPRTDARNLPADPPDVSAPTTTPPKPDPNPGKAGK